MIHKQRGMTFIGLLTIFLLVGIVAYGGIRVLPVYMEYFKVATVLSGLKNELDGKAATRSDIMRSLEKRLGIESVRSMRGTDFKISKVSGGHRVGINYERKAPYVANVEFLITFKKSVQIVR